MDQTKVERFWQAVVDRGNTLRALLNVSSSDFKAIEAFALTCEIEEMVRSAVSDIDPLLSADLEQRYGNGDMALLIVITCNGNSAGIEAVQQLVATAPALPPCFQVCAFRPPVPKERLCQRRFLGVYGTDIPVEQVRFMVLPSNATPGIFDIACFVPPSSKTEMDPDKVPGASVAYMVLIMGIGELRFMTRIKGLKVAVMEAAPEEAVAVWDLLEIIDHAPMQ
jgi:hypothetical protein